MSSGSKQLYVLHFKPPGGEWRPVNEFPSKFALLAEIERLLEHHREPDEVIDFARLAELPVGGEFRTRRGLYKYTVLNT